MSEHFADVLLDASASRRAPVCVGIDPVYERLPEAVRRQSAGREIQAVVAFSREVIAAVAALVPAVKINSAYFERYAGAGFDAYFELIACARECGLVVIGDCKRGDVGHTALQYARSQFQPGTAAGGAGGAAAGAGAGPHAVTLQPYLGWEAIEPFCDERVHQGRGVFVLVQTSNPSAAALQDLPASDGRSLSEHVGGLVEGWARAPGRMGRCGYSSIGAVVAPRDVARARVLRACMPSCLFLVPGYGAQGAGPAEVAACFKADGRGAIVNASRSVIYAYEQPQYESAGRWTKAVEQACRQFVADVGAVLGGAS